MRSGRRECKSAAFRACTDSDLGVQSAVRAFVCAQPAQSRPCSAAARRTTAIFHLSGSGWCNWRASCVCASGGAFPRGVSCSPSPPHRGRSHAHPCAGDGALQLPGADGTKARRVDAEVPRPHPAGPPPFVFGSALSAVLLYTFKIGLQGPVSLGFHEAPAHAAASARTCASEWLAAQCHIALPLAADYRIYPQRAGWNRTPVFRRTASAHTCPSGWQRSAKGGALV